MRASSITGSGLSRFLAALTLLPIAYACSAGDVAPPEPVDLRAAERSVFSQFGEDGVIEKIFEIVEPGPKFAVEFGASNGIKNSNLRNLVVDHGWSTFQIEGDPERAEELAKNYEAYPTTRTTQAWVWPGNVEILFEENGVPREFDLLVIDIDSNDYYVWRAIRDFHPKVVMIEANLFFPPPQLMVIDYHPMNYWDHTYYTGASLQSLYNLGKKRGYELIYQMSRGPNVFFVAEEYFDRFGIADNSPSKIYRRPPEEAMKKPRAHWGRDGVPWPKGKDVLTWNKLVIKKKFIFDR
jgi:hypothetical protein